MCSNGDMDEKVIFSNDCLNIRVQQKNKGVIFAEMA